MSIPLSWGSGYLLGSSAISITRGLYPSLSIEYPTSISNSEHQFHSSQCPKLIPFGSSLNSTTHIAPVPASSPLHLAIPKAQSPLREKALVELTSYHRAQWLAKRPLMDIGRREESSDSILCYNNMAPYSRIKVMANAQGENPSISLNSLHKIRLLKITNKKVHIKGSMRILSETRTSIAFLGKNKNLAINHPINFQFSFTKWVSLVKPGMGQAKHNEPRYELNKIVKDDTLKSIRIKHE